jgi:hypothetical protein
MGYYIIAAFALAGMFVLFLVLSRTLNSIVNHLTKLEYLLQKELDLQKEMIIIKKMLKEKDESEQGEAPATNKNP